MSLQQLFDFMSKSQRDTRSDYHLTLDGLIECCINSPQEYTVTFENGDGVGNPHSYRGYYSDLSFETTNEVKTVKEMWALCCHHCLDQTFEGYKGGDFLMTGSTPLWCADYGCCGEAIVEAYLDSPLKRVILRTKDVD